MPRKSAQLAKANLTKKRQALAVELSAPSTVGRPRKIDELLTDKSMQTIKGLGQIHATDSEIAAVLGIDEATWYNAKRAHPDIVEVLTVARAEGKTSLRRAQFRTAVGDAKNKLQPNPTMQIWLGKQLLGQHDKQELLGPGGGPLQVLDVSRYTPAELTVLAQAVGLLDRLGAPSIEGSDSGGTDEA